jgi:hypothetical protein
VVIEPLSARSVGNSLSIWKKLPLLSATTTPGSVSTLIRLLLPFTETPGTGQGTFQRPCSRKGCGRVKAKDFPVTVKFKPFTAMFASMVVGKVIVAFPNGRLVWGR